MLTCVWAFSKLIWCWKYIVKEKLKRKPLFPRTEVIMFALCSSKSLCELHSNKKSPYFTGRQIPRPFPGSRLTPDHLRLAKPAGATLLLRHQYSLEKQTNRVPALVRDKIFTLCDGLPGCWKSSLGVTDKHFNTVFVWERWIAARTGIILSTLS